MCMMLIACLLKSKILHVYLHLHLQAFRGKSATIDSQANFFYQEKTVFVVFISNNKSRHFVFTSNNKSWTLCFYFKQQVLKSWTFCFYFKQQILDILLLFQTTNLGNFVLFQTASLGH